MNRYQILAGQHIEQVGEKGKTVYKKGDKVDSNQDLVALFPQKFLNLGPVLEPVKKEAARPQPPKDTEPVDEVEADVDAEEEDKTEKPAEPAKRVVGRPFKKGEPRVYSKVKAKDKDDDWDD